MRAIVAIFLVALAAPAAAARPVMIVHGLDPTGSPPSHDYDAGGWSAGERALETWGVEGPRVRWRYYACDRGHDEDAHLHPAGLDDHGHGRHFGGPAAHARSACGGGMHDQDTPIEHVAYHLAWGLDDLYGEAGTCVDVVAHSMGGLVARYALAAVERRDPEFPASLCVRNVVTLGTPHAGADAARACGLGRAASHQCQELTPGSAFLAALATDAPRPEGRGGTTWIAIGSEADEVVRPDSAVALDFDHAAVHALQDRVPHFCCGWYFERTDEAATANVREKDRGGSWESTAAGLWPVRRAFLALSVAEPDVPGEAPAATAAKTPGSAPVLVLAGALAVAFARRRAEAD